MAPPSKPLPYGPKHHSADDYISALLAFVTESHLHQALCGGVHILDFLTRDPDLYISLIPEEWRIWFADVDIDDVLDLLLREDLKQFDTESLNWRRYPVPPRSLLEYIIKVRDLTLDRSFAEPTDRPVARLDRHLAVGMNVKKEHEVSHFASFVSNLTDDLAGSSKFDVCHHISHLVDFGSGQNYLGRVLAGPRYGKNVVALESRPTNIDQARKMDVHAKLAKKQVVWRNKKTWAEDRTDTAEEDRLAALKDGQDPAAVPGISANGHMHSSGNKVSDEVARRIKYVEHVIKDGNLDDVVAQLEQTKLNQDPSHGDGELGLLVMSLHSCGNLVHHGLRSLVLNPNVKAVAMIGCCYNLCTERLGPATYKLPSAHLRSANQRVTDTALTCDPHGFPMSERFLKYPKVQDSGIRFNITARMMAVQAPTNWTKAECEGFFTRHFYRALIQRIFLDTGFVNAPVAGDEVIGGSIRGWAGGTEPIIIGRLTKAHYSSFVAYVRGATRKICLINPEQGRMLLKCLEGMSDEDLAGYEKSW